MCWLGLLLSGLSVWVQADVVPCSGVAKQAGLAFETRSDWFASEIQNPPAQVNLSALGTLKAQFKHWQVWENPQISLQGCAPQVETIQQQAIRLYPVIWHKLKKVPVVVTGKIRVQVASAADLLAIEKHHPLVLEQHLPLAFSAVFATFTPSFGAEGLGVVSGEVSADHPPETDLDKVLRDLNFDPTVMSAKPVLSYQRYQLR